MRVRPGSRTCKRDPLARALQVPASHGNKYGYGTEGVVITTANNRCLVRLDHTDEERWHPSALVRRWVRPDVEGLSHELAQL